MQNTASVLVDEARIAASDNLRRLQAEGRTKDAIRVCLDANARWPENLYFKRVLCDLYMQIGSYGEAFVALGNFLGTNKPSAKLINDFGKRYHRFRKVVPAHQLQKYAALLSSSLDAANIHNTIKRGVRIIISKDLPAVVVDQNEKARKLSGLLQDDAQFDAFVREEKALEQAGLDIVLAVLDGHVLNRARSPKTFRIDLHCVSIYEKFGQRQNALKMVSELIELRPDTVAIRSLFRLCRLGKDYALADALLERSPQLMRSNEFNMLYEFVYYFESKNDYHAVQGILRTIDKSFSTNLPVLRTLKNFYIRFGLVEEARGLEKKIDSLSRNAKAGKSAKYTAEAAESEIAIASKVQDLYSQLEHQKQLAAISDLTTGISHELGQPITNIRYTVQFYRRVFEKDLSYERVVKVFDSILEETQRMGGLIRRLSPLTSSKSVATEFDIISRIRLRVEAEKPRLTESNIEVTVSPSRQVLFFGDPVKFDQLISNLLLNAIDAIDEKHPSDGGAIEIKVTSKDDIKIQFDDTGVGIPLSNRNKIFDPFFSTKPPGKGEGLGLFIIWNLLKMMGGSVAVDKDYRKGARFLISLPINHAVSPETV